MLSFSNQGALHPRVPRTHIGVSRHLVVPAGTAWLTPREGGWEKAWRGLEFLPRPLKGEESLNTLMSRGHMHCQQVTKSCPSQGSSH